MDDLKMVVSPQNTGGRTRMMMMMMMLSLILNLSQEISIRCCEFMMNNYENNLKLKKHVRRTNRMTSPAKLQYRRRRRIWMLPSCIYDIIRLCLRCSRNRNDN